MPRNQEILAQLSRIASDAWPVAVAWHLLLAAALVALVLGLRPTRRVAAALLSLPLASVAVTATLYGNPFNGSVFAVLALGTLLGALRLPRVPVETGPRLLPAAGALSVGLGWFYPAFLADAPAWMALVATPVGLIPCPTLLVVVGLGLMAGGFGSRAWSASMGAVALFYGLFGALALGVWFDLALAAAGLAALALARRGDVLEAHHRRASALADERAHIDAFLALRRIALVGASRHPQHFSRIVMEALRDDGVDVVPIHLEAADIAGVRAFASLAEVEPPVDGVLIMTPADASAEVVEEAAAAGIRHVWLHRGGGPGAVSDAAIAAARQHGMELVPGRCPLMFLGHPPDAPHRAHARMLRWVDRFPERLDEAVGPTRT